MLDKLLQIAELLAYVAIVAGGVGFFRLYDGNFSSAPYMVAICVPVFVFSYLWRSWMRYARKDGIARTALSADRSLLLVERSGGYRCALRVSDGVQVAKNGAVVLADAASDSEIGFRRDKVTYGDDYARLWLSGDQRMVLQGLEARPGKHKTGAFISGGLVVTRAILEGVPKPLPVLVRHVESLDDGSAELLTSVNYEEGGIRWTMRFARPALDRARHLFTFPEQLIFLFVPEFKARSLNGSLVRRVTGPCEALALDAATGAERWRARL